MLFQKGSFIKFVLRNKFLLLNLSLLILIFCSVFARMNNENKASVEVYQPVYKVETEKNVYSVTVNINGDEEEKDVKLLSQILKGLNVKSTFFVYTEWLEDNYKLANKILKDGHTFGLLLKNTKASVSREDVMYIMASENDKFFKYSKIYPTFVRIESDKSGKIPELLNAFGQIYISSSIVLNNDSSTIDAGDILSVSEINSETPFNVAEFIGKCSNDNYISLPLEELFKLEPQCESDKPEE